MTEEIRQLRQELENNPQDTEAFRALNEHYRANRDWRGLLELYTGGIADEIASLDALAAQLRDIANRLEDKEEKGALLVVLGDIYIEHLDQREEAMSAYQESFKVWPKDTTCLERARSIYTEAGDYERVIVLYELQTKVLDKTDRHAELARTYTEMSEVFGEHLDNTTKALELVLRARELDPSVAQSSTLYERYRSVPTLGENIEEMMAQADELAEINPREASRLLCRAARLERAREDGDLERSSRLIERAVELDEDNTEAVHLWEAIESDLSSATGAETVEAPEEVLEEIREAERQQAEEDDLDEDSGVVPTLSGDDSSNNEFAREAQEKTDLLDLSDQVREDLDEEDEEEYELDEYVLEEIDPSEASDVLMEKAAQVAAQSQVEMDSEATQEINSPEEAATIEADPIPEDAAVSDEEQAAPEEPEHQRAELELLDPEQIEEVDEEAFAAAQSALDDEPTDLEALGVVTRELARRGEWEALVERMEHSVKYLRRKEGEFDAMLQLAMVLWRQLEDLDRAEYYFKRLRHHDSEMPEVLAFYEEFFEAKEQWRKLHVHLGTLLDAAQTQADKLRITERMAQLSEREMSSPEKAIDAWRSYSLEFPEDRHSRDELRRLYEEYEKWGALVDYLREEAGALSEVDAEHQHQRVQLLEEVVMIYREHIPGGDLNRINALNEILAIDADHREAFEELKGLLEANRRYSEMAGLLSEQAEAAYGAGDIDRAVELLTEVADLWQERLNNVSQALPFLQRITEIDPQHDPTRARLKEIYTQRRDFASLFDVLEEETKTKSGEELEAHLRDLLELAQERLRDMGRAEALLERLLELSPTDVELIEKLETIYRRKDAPDKLAGLLQDKATLDAVDRDEVIAAYKEAAQLYENKLEDADEAARLWREVLALDEGNATAFARLRDILLEHRRFDALFELFAERDNLERYYDTLAMLADRSDDPEDQQTIYRQMATLAEEHLEETSKVISSLERLLEVAEEPPVIARELIEWYAHVEDIASQIEAHQLLLEHAEGEDERFAELVRLAELEIEREQDEAALRWQLEAIAIKPEVSEAVQKAEDLARHVEMLEMFLDHLEGIAEQREEASESQKALLHRVARLARDDIEDNARAIAIFERLLEMEPASLQWLQALEELYDIAAYPDKRIDALRRSIEVLEEEGAAELRVVEQLAKIADVQHRHKGEQDEARETYTSILEVDPDFLPAIHGLREIYAAEGEWDRVVEMLERAFELTDLGAEEERVSIQMELAGVWRSYKEEPAEALRYYSDVLQNHPDHEDALTRVEELLEVDEVAREAALLIEPLLRQSDQYARLAGALEARLRVCDDDFEEREILDELVPLYREQLEDPEAAFPRAARRFELDPSNEARWQEMRGLAEELERWEDLEELFAAWAPLEEGSEEEHGGRVELLRHLANIRADHLKDSERALEAWERLYHFEPMDLSVIDSLIGLYEQLSRQKELVRVLEAKADVVTEPEERVALLMRAAQLTDAILEDTSGAIVLYQRVIEIEPSHPEAVKKLEELLRAEERYFDLDELFTEQASMAETPERRRDFLLQQAALRANNLGELNGAFSILQRLVQEDMEDPRAVMLMVHLDNVVAEEDEQAPLRLDIALELEQLYRAKADWPKLIEILEVRLSFTDDPYDRIALLDELSEQHRTHVVDHERAFDRTREAVILMPEEVERRELLEQLGERLGREEDVVEAYITAAEAADPFVAAPLYKRSGQILADDLGQPERAIEVYEAALEAQDTDEETLAALEKLYTYTSDWERLADNLRAQAQYADPDRRMELLRRVGDLEEQQLERPIEAIEAWSELREMDPTAMEPMRALERLYESEERWVDLAEILRNKANFTDDEAAKLPILHKLAMVYEERLEEPLDAVNVWREVRMIEPHNSDALDALDRLFVEQGSWPDLADVLRAKLKALREDEEPRPERRTELELRLADVLAEELLNVDEALDLYLAVFDREPGQEDARAAMERYASDPAYAQRVSTPLINYYRGSELWEELVALYAELREIEHDPHQRAEYSWAIAMVERDRLERLPEAMEAMSQAWRLRPERDEWRGELIAVADAREAYEELAQVYEDVLMEVSDPDRIKTLRVEVAEIYRDRLDNPIDAEQHLREALDIDERDLSNYAILEEMLSAQERWQDLIDLLDRRYMVFAGEPGAKDLLLRIANIWDEFVEDPIAAIDAYRRVLMEDPDDVVAPKAINRLYRDRGNYQDLSMFLEDRLGVVADDPEATLALRTELADLYAEELHESERALDLWRQILEDTPLHEPTIASLEAMFADDELMREPVAQTLEPIYREQEQWTKLVDLLTLKADDEQDPFTQVELRREIARIAEGKLRDWTRALHTYAHLFEAVPEDADVRAALERLGERLTAWDDVVETYEETLANNFNIGDDLRTQMLLELGLIHEERRDDLHTAQETFARVQEVEPGHQGAFEHLERVLGRLDDWQGLADLYQGHVDSLFDADEQLVLLERLGTLHEEVLDDLERAVEVTERMLQIDPSNPHTSRTLERLYKETGWFEELADLYRRLMIDASGEEGEQRSLAMRYKLAQLLEAELDQIDDALAIYTEILTDHPGHRDTLRALEGLRRDLTGREGDWGQHLSQIAQMLLDNYSESQDWRRIVELLDLKKSSTEDTSERIDLLDRAAGLVNERADERSDLFSALSYRTEAWALRPDDEENFMKLAPLAEHLDAWERVIPQVLSGLEESELPEEKARLLNAAARVYRDKLDDRESALIAYEQTLEVDSTNDIALRQLEGLYGEFGHWEPLVRLLKLMLEQTFDGEERVNLLQRVANLYERTLEQPREAIAAYEELREMDPGTRAYLDALSGLYERTEQDQELADVLLAKVDMIEDDSERLGTLKKLAQVQQEFLQDEVGAIDSYRRILTIDDNDERAVNALVDLYAASEQWHELLEMLEVQRDFAADLEPLNHIDFRRAQIMVDHVGQPFDALEILQTIALRSPGWTEAVEMMTEMLDEEMVREDAFEALESLHRQAEDFEALANVYEKRLEYLEEPNLRTESFSKLAELQERELDSPTMALTTYGRAFRDMPTNEEVRAELERLGGMLSAQEMLIGIYEDTLDAGVEDTEAVKRLHRRLGELYVDELEDADAAIGHLESVLEIDEYDVDALEMLDRLYQYKERWEDLADVLNRQIAVAPPEKLAQARYRLGYLRERIFEQPLDAFDLYRQVVIEQPDHRKVIEALERLIEEESLRAEVIDLLEVAYKETETWGKLSQLLKLKLGVLDVSSHERAELMRRVAEIEVEHRDDPATAFEFYGKALSEDPFDVDTQERLEELAAQTQQWGEIVETYDAIIAELDDPVRQAELALKAGEWSRTVLEDDLERAERLYTIVLDSDPQNFEALEALEFIYRQRGDQDKLVEVLGRKAEVIFEPDERFEALFELGHLLAQAERYDEAIDAMRDAAMIQGGDREVLRALVDLYEQTEQWMELVDQLERLVEVTDDEEATVELLSRIGREVDEHLEDAPRAIGAYERALSIRPTSLELLRAVEPLYSKTGQLDALSDNLETQLELAESDEDRVRVMVSRAKIAYDHRNDPEEAIELFQQAYEMSPTSPIITDALDELYRAEERWVELFNLYYNQLERAEDDDRRAELASEMARISHSKLGDSDTAVQYVDYALNLLPHHAPTLETRIEIYRDLGDLEAVAQTMGTQFEAAETDEAKIDVLLRRAEMYRDTLEQPQEAIEDFVEVLNVDPEHERAYDELTTLLNELEAWEQLYDVMQFRVDVLPEQDRKQMYLDMAEVARNMGDVPKRVEALEQAYQLDPSDLDVVEPLLDAAIANEMFDRAEPMLEEVIEALTEKRRMKDVVRFYHLRGKLAEQQGDQDAALEAYEAARKVDATYVPNLLSLGKMLYQKQDWDQALKIFQTLLLHQMSIERDEEKVEMYYHLGQVRLHKGDERRAKDMFNRALGIDKEHAPSLEALEQL